MKKIYNAPIMKVANLDLNATLLTGSIGTSDDPATQNGSNDGTVDQTESRVNNLWDNEW